MKFTVDRSRWLNGYTLNTLGDGISYLENDQGAMCCMGFLAKACGVTKFKNIGMLQGYWRIPVALKDESSVGSIYTLNDDKKISRSRREERLTKKLAKLGITVKFVGKYPAKL